MPLASPAQWRFREAANLANRRNYVLLWTAYSVERQHRRDKLHREYETYQKTLTPP